MIYFFAQNLSSKIMKLFKVYNLNNLGIHYKKKNYQKALKYYSQALTISKKKIIN